MKTGSRPYLKFLIAGGVICANGGTFLPYGLEIFFLMGDLPSNFLRSMGITFIVIGAVSLCIGLSLLFKGVHERNLWLQIHQGNIRRGSTYLDEEEPLERPMRRAPLRVNVERRFCAICGTLLPSLPNIKFCPKCGEAL